MPAAAVLALLALAPAVEGLGPKSTRGFFATNGTTLYYEVAGSGPPVALVHGGWMSSAQWDPQFAILSRKYRVLRYDMRGHGRSPLGQPVSPYSQAEDLSALLGHARMEKPHVVGVSAGAQAAIDLALADGHAVASLLLGASPLAGFEMGKEFTEGMAGIVSAGAADDLQLVHDRVWAFAPFRVAAAMPDVRRRLDDMIVRQNTWAGRREGAPRPKRPQTPPAARLGEIRVPALVVVGDGEMPALRGEADYVARGIPGARLVVIKGAGHFPNLEQPGRFDDVVLDWLKRQGARGESR